MNLKIKDEINNILQNIAIHNFNCSKFGNNINLKFICDTVPNLNVLFPNGMIVIDNKLLVVNVLLNEEPLVQGAILKAQVDCVRIEMQNRPLIQIRYTLLIEGEI